MISKYNTDVHISEIVPPFSRICGEITETSIIFEGYVL